MSHPTADTANPEIVKRLRRAIGQLNTVVAMIEDHRECAEVAMQLQAAEKAVARQALAELHEISKYL